LVRWFEQQQFYVGAMAGNADGILMCPKSQCQITVTIDSVSVETFIYIVEDADVKYDLLIGHSFTEHPTVRIVKTQKHLQITRLPSDAGARLGPRFDINRVEVNRPFGEQF
jgi:hypothetical protein